MNKKQQRQQNIIALVEAAGYESIESLADSLRVSDQTIRRDIKELDTDHLLRRTHGGAASVGSVEPSITSTEYVMRRSTAVREKQIAADLAVAQVQDGQSVFLDAGTTCLSVAKALRQKHDLKIVSYSLTAAMILKDVTGFDVAIPGGFVRNVEGSLYGDGVAEFLERFRFDVAILSASGVAEDGTVSDDNHWEVDVVTRAMARSRRSILVIDHKKFDRSGYVELCHISEFDVLTTDCPPSEQMQDLAGSCQLLWPGCDQRPANGTV